VGEFKKHRGFSLGDKIKDVERKARIREEGRGFLIGGIRFNFREKKSH